MAISAYGYVLSHSPSSSVSTTLPVGPTRHVWGDNPDPPSSLRACCGTFTRVLAAAASRDRLRKRQHLYVRTYIIIGLMPFSLPYSMPGGTYRWVSAGSCIEFPSHTPGRSSPSTGHSPPPSPRSAQKAKPGGTATWVSASSTTSGVLLTLQRQQARPKRQGWGGSRVAEWIGVSR